MACGGQAGLPDRVETGVKERAGYGAGRAASGVCWGKTGPGSSQGMEGTPSSQGMLEADTR